MIKFFRKIRQRLLSENKFNKYLLYAIGEIILVVIGILIALQINNWNERQKREKLKSEYINSLIIDYSKDTLQLNARLLSNKLRLNKLDTIGTKIETGVYNRNEDYVYLLLNEANGIRVTNIYNTNSFNLLISSGNIDLLEKTIRTELMELNRLQNYENSVQNGNKNYLFKYMENIGLKYPLFGSPYSKDITSKLIWNKVKLESLPKDITALLKQEHYTINRYVELSERVLRQTELVLKLLVKNND